MIDSAAPASRIPVEMLGTSTDFWPLYAIGVAGLVVGLLLLLLPARGYLRWLRRRKDPESPARRPGLTSSALEAMGGITLLAVAVAAASLLLALQGYRAMSEKTLCAEVRAAPVKGQAGRIFLEYYPVAGGRRCDAEKKTYVMNGDLWGVEGSVLRWSDWARFAGLKTCFRVTRVSCKYSPPRPPGTHPTEIYFGGEDNWLWRMLRRNDNRLPGVEASWHSGAHREPVDGAVFEVWVTPGGYMVKRK